MKTLHSFEELKTISKDQRIGWFLLEAKSLHESLHAGYLNCLDELKKKNDIVIVDLVHFGALCQAVWTNNVFIPKLGIPLEIYQEFLKDHADFLFYQSPEDQVMRRFGICEKVTDKGYYKKLINSRCIEYPYYAGWGNLTILKTYCWLYQTYPSFLNINQAGNIWECGHRSFLYRDYLKRYLGIDMLVTAPARTGTGLIPKSENTYLDPALEQELISLNILLKQKRFTELKQNKYVEDVFIFDHKQFDKGLLVEVFVNKKDKKGRLIEHFDH